MEEFGQTILVILGVVTAAAFVIMTVGNVIEGGEKTRCEHENNVYQCERTYTPVNIEKEI
jgi:hypothetical protein